MQDSAEIKNKTNQKNFVDDFWNFSEPTLLSQVNVLHLIDLTEIQIMYSSKKKRHRSRSRSRSPRSRKRPYEIQFEKHRSKLNKIFFRDEDLIQFGSDEYKDFWKFLAKYQNFQRMKQKQPKSSSSNYNKRLCQNFRLCPKNPQDLLNRISYDEDSDLTVDIVSEFQTVLSLYIDFLQKEKFNKLKKLRQSQANLPIAEFRQEIVQTLEQNQVVIIAGDTGCGKSKLQKSNYTFLVSYT